MRPIEFTTRHPTATPRDPTLAGAGPNPGCAARQVTRGHIETGEKRGTRIMKGLLRRARAASLSSLLAMVAGRATAASATGRRHGSLVGTGATFPFPLVSKWIPRGRKAYGINITYSPTGSGAGIASITARTVDFGASDAPLSPDQLDACKGCVVIPWALAAMSVPYNLPGVDARLRLNGPTLANIYLGKITNWNDPAIKGLNPKLNLPDLEDHARLPFGRIGHHVRVHRLPVGRQPAVEEPRRHQHERQLPGGRRRARQLGRGRCRQDDGRRV